MEDPLSKSSFLSKNKVNYKVITIIVGIAIIFQIFNVYIIPQELDELDPIEILLTTSYVISAIVAFSLAKKYTGSKIFAVAYFFFGMGELMIVLGEIVWNYLEISGMTTYPSIADVFYFGVYPFLILHLVLNIRFFKRKIGVKTKTWLVVFPVSIIMVSAFFMFTEIGEIGFDFYYSMIFITEASILFTLSILGASVFRNSYIANVWAVLAIGLCISSFADIWYYFAEVLGTYDRTHTTEFLWLLSTMVMIYAIHKHRKLI